MAIIPNLYLKWGLFRSLFGRARSDAQIAKAIFGTDDAAPTFSKMMAGAIGCPPEIAAELAKVMNLSIDVHRRDRKIAPNSDRMTATDLQLSVFEFAQRLIAVAETIEADKLDDAHRRLLAELAPRSAKDASPFLVVERYAPERSFEAFSGGDAPVVFQAGYHLGQLSLQGVDEAPAAVYAFLTRDPQSVGCRLWDLSWRETMLWLPSPFTPTKEGNRLNLMATPTPVRPIPGRFLATAVLVLDRSTIGDLDPRGADPTPAILDEEQAGRFLGNVRRLLKRKEPPIIMATSEYSVVLPAWAASPSAHTNDDHPVVH